MYVYHLLIYFTLRIVWFSRIAPKIGYHLVTSLGFIALTVLLVMAVAAFSFHFIETPFLRLKRYFPSPAAPV
jgi:peptidoglycan/LPS O-acetylase OafA/YrhL